MATTTATRFQPTTDSFGQLTVHAARSVRALPINLLLVLAFIAVLATAMTGLSAFDNAFFAHTHFNAIDYYSMPMD